MANRNASRAHRDYLLAFSAKPARSVDPLADTHKLGGPRTGRRRVRIQNQYFKLRLKPQNLLS